MNGTIIWFDDMYVNATAANASYGTNWVQNTDGFDTTDANNVKLTRTTHHDTNMAYQGGDECIAIKPRSYNTYVQNVSFRQSFQHGCHCWISWHLQVTCHGGNGIAIGSLGQYQEDSSVINAVIKDVNILIMNKDQHNSAYIKTYMGASLPQASYNSAGLPSGGGW